MCVYEYIIVWVECEQSGGCVVFWEYLSVRLCFDIYYKKNMTVSVTGKITVSVTMFMIVSLNFNITVTITVTLPVNLNITVCDCYIFITVTVKE